MRVKHDMPIRYKNNGNNGGTGFALTQDNPADMDCRTAIAFESQGGKRNHEQLYSRRHGGRCRHTDRLRRLRPGQMMGYAPQPGYGYGGGQPIGVS